MFGKMSISAKVTLKGILLSSLLMLSSTIVQAKEYPLPPANSRLVGEPISYIVPDDGRPLETIAAEFSVGLLALMSANPGVDPLLPKAGSELIIPSWFLLPDVPREGIVLNLSELRLYYFPSDKNVVYVYPIGIGQLGRETPVTKTKVISKRANPTWTPTEKIRENYAQQGIELPPFLPAGPDNPMGLFAIRLAEDNGTYLIHGTNASFGIGLRVSSGCIRLRPSDIEELFNMVPVGIPVNIINEPIKYSVEPNGRRYLEVHQPLSRTEYEDPQTLPITLNQTANLFLENQSTDQLLSKQAIIDRRGYPIDVSNLK